MPKACDGDQHVFYNIETVFPSGFVFKVDEDGMFRCYCGKITLTQFSSPSPMCDACHHPQTHHLFGYCYGPVEYECTCLRFVSPPPKVLGSRKITLLRKIILGDQIIGGLPPQEPEPPALPAEHPHVVGSYRALCTCGHTGQMHRGNPGDTRCLHCSLCSAYQRREYVPELIAVQGTSYHPIMFSAGPWQEISAPPFNAGSSAAVALSSYACPGCNGNFVDATQLALHLSLAHPRITSNDPAAPSSNGPRVGGLLAEEWIDSFSFDNQLIGRLMISRTLSPTDQTIRIERHQFVKPQFGPFMLLTITIEIITAAAIVNASPPPPGVPYRPTPDSPLMIQHEQRFNAARAAYQWARRLMGNSERANRSDSGICQCGHRMHSHNTDRTGMSPEPCILCPCNQYRQWV